MGKNYPENQKENFLINLANDLAYIEEENTLRPEQAYSRLVLKTFGFDFDEDQYSDGAGEFGVDYWDSSEEESAIFQFKSRDYYNGINYSDQVVPDDLKDLHRINSLLKDLNEPPKSSSTNQSFNRFVEKLRHNISRHLEKTHSNLEDPYEIYIHLCVLASEFTVQAKDEYNRLCKQAIEDLKNKYIKLIFVNILIDDLIEKKWKVTNTEWKDCNGKNRNHFDLTISGNKIIGMPKSCVFFTKAIDLVDCFNSFGYQIFEPNVRCEVPQSEVNRQIRASINSHLGRKEFKHLNNGITMICSNYEKPKIKDEDENKEDKKIKIIEPGIINGLQTVISISEGYNQLSSDDKKNFTENCFVLVRLHMMNAVKDYKALVKSTNNQNPMQPRNLRSNDPEQIYYEKLFADLNWFYERKQGAWAAFKSNPKLWKTMENKKVSDFQIAPRKYRTIDNEGLAQCWLSFIGYSLESVHKAKDIFKEDDDLYDLIFLSRPSKHGFSIDYDYKNIKTIDKENQSPPPDLMLMSWLLRLMYQKMMPSQKKNRDMAIKRLRIEGIKKDLQDKKLNDDNQYLQIIVFRAWSYLFPEFIGYILFKSLNENVYLIGNKLLNNFSLNSFKNNINWDELITKYEKDDFDENDFLLVMYALFRECAEQVYRKIIDDWKNASNRTRFNYSPTLRKLLIKEIEETDKFISKNVIPRTWATGLCKNKGIFNFVKKILN